MRIITTKIEAYKFEELSDNAKQAAKEYFDNNGFFNDILIDERIHTLKELSKEIDGKLEYSISCVGDRGEYITIKDYDSEELKKLYAKKEECPLTGVCYDIDILEDIEEVGMVDALDKYLTDIHNEYQSFFDDTYFTEHCAMNDYEFTKMGVFI